MIDVVVESIVDEQPRVYTRAMATGKDSPLPV
jgi:hypothetical protein